MPCAHSTFRMTRRDIDDGGRTAWPRPCSLLVRHDRSPAESQPRPRGQAAPPRTTAPCAHGPATGVGENVRECKKFMALVQVTWDARHGRLPPPAAPPRRAAHRCVWVVFVGLGTWARVPQQERASPRSYDEPAPRALSASPRPSQSALPSFCCAATTPVATLDRR